MSRYLVKIREPYMGNQVPLEIFIKQTDGEITSVEVKNPEGITVTARHAGGTDFSSNADV